MSCVFVCLFFAQSVKADSPTDKDIHSGLQAFLNASELDFQNGQSIRAAMPKKIQKYKIGNSYIKKVQDEDCHCYEFSALIYFPGDENTFGLKGTFALIKRGNDWYETGVEDSAAMSLMKKDEINELFPLTPEELKTQQELQVKKKQNEETVAAYDSVIRPKQESLISGIPSIRIGFNYKLDDDGNIVPGVKIQERGDSFYFDSASKDQIMTYLKKFSEWDSIITNQDKVEATMTTNSDGSVTQTQNNPTPIVKNIGEISDSAFKSTFQFSYKYWSALDGDRWMNKGNWGTKSYLFIKQEKIGSADANDNNVVCFSATAISQFQNLLPLLPEMEVEAQANLHSKQEKRDNAKNLEQLLK